MPLLTGSAYRSSLRDGRQVWVSGERIADVASHPVFRPMVDNIAAIYDLHFAPDLRDVMTYVRADGARCSRFYKIPESVEDLRLRREMTMAGARPRLPGNGPLWRRDRDAAVRGQRPQGAAGSVRPPLLPGRTALAGPAADHQPVHVQRQHRSQGRPVPPALGAARSRHVCPRGARNRGRHRDPRREVRDRGALRARRLRQANRWVCGTTPTATTPWRASCG